MKSIFDLLTKQPETLKSDYIIKRKKLEKKHKEYILQKLLPPFVQKTIKQFICFEKRYNLSKKYPLCSKYFSPVTKKEVNRLSGFTLFQWVNYFKKFAKDKIICREQKRDIFYVKEM